MAKTLDIIRKETLDVSKEKLPPESVQKQLNIFMREIPTVGFFKPDGKPKKEWRVLYGETWDETKVAAEGVTGNTIFGVPKNDAAWVAWDAARDAERDTARYAAMGAARNVVRDAAGDAAWDAARGAVSNAAIGAALMAGYIIVSDLEFKGKEEYLAYVKSIWEVYQKGYGLMGDVDGVLYVYCKGKPPEEQTRLLRPGGGWVL